jgi:hypothetical protein
MATRNNISPGETRQLKVLVGNIVRAQGNIFIRELLRDKKLPIGTKKDDFEANLYTAIEKGNITRSEILAWLQEVEGWGDQHVYLYSIPDTLVDDQMWSKRDEMQKRLPEQQRRLWNSDSPNLFPNKRTLTGIHFDGTTLQFVWHQRLANWVRTPKHDQKNVEIEGDTYELRAYRDRPGRSVQRFVLRLDLRLAAVFLEVPWSKSAHDAARGEIQTATNSLVDWKTLKALSASDVIKNLDQMELSALPDFKVASQKTRFADASTYVEFATSSPDAVYQDSQAVREVRRAVRLDDFTGSSGLFRFDTKAPQEGKSRQVRVEIFEDSRVRLWHQLQATEVWEILNTLRRAEKWVLTGKP